MPAADQARPLSDAEAAILFADLAACKSVVIAASGGPDSTALCLLAARWRASLTEGPVLHAVTIDHGLRPEAAGEAVAVQRLAAALGMPHHTLKWDGSKPATGLQEAARAARYRLLAEQARRLGAHHIVTAHTGDDQAETVLFRLARGSGLCGLAGMARVAPLPVSVFGAGTGASTFNTPSRFVSSQACAGGASLPATLGSLLRTRGRVGEEAPSTPDDQPGERLDQRLLLVRPFLDVPKARLIATLAAAGIAFADDPSNHDPRFTRVRWRRLLPALAAEGLTPERLGRFARRARRADDAIEAAVDQLALQVTEATLGDRAGQDRVMSLAAVAFFAAPEEIRLRLLGRLVALLGDEGPVELGKLEACERALAAHCCDQKTVGFCRTLAGAIVRMSNGQVSVGRAPPRRRRHGAAEARFARAAPAVHGNVHQALPK